MTSVIAEPCVDVLDRAGEESAGHTPVGAQLFDVVGPPGGAAKLGALPTDHPTVAALPITPPVRS